MVVAHFIISTTLLTLAAANNWATYPQVPKTASINGFADPIYGKLPDCAQPCVKKGTGNTPCPYWDTGCFCVMPQWSGQVAECIASQCKGEEVSSATSLAISLCSSVGANTWMMPGTVSSALQQAAGKDNSIASATSSDSGDLSSSSSTSGSSSSTVSQTTHSSGQSASAMGSKRSSSITSAPSSAMKTTSASPSNSSSQSASKSKGAAASVTCTALWLAIAHMLSFVFA
ncbi:Piso0_005780 [Millerozyma farinosa CBS 7064]|uniref:Piso0_005780 protein n=1 Tax=Pichia sorbitophila (strain ATCC MYA-4447 / BCRC 22081 / CBS 7064 / NBRC 10061 / NRRL Y-12695) TaxID=559304 RepID=G8XZX8_PICSO|nr:Piso0_005780 [Millerozyma farinosa CBS 7064]